MPRIAIGGFGHETNSFVSHRADYAYFADHRDRPPLVRGSAIFDWLRDGVFPITAFIEAMRDEHVLIPLAWAHGGAGGPVTDDAFERIAGELVGRLSEAMPIDAVYLDLHGAMASIPFEDAEGELLRRVRTVVGDRPIVVSLDYHANITPEMVEHCDGMVVFLTYPHVDRRETGERAAKLLSSLLGKPRPAGRAVRHIPFLIPTTSQCTLVEPSRSIVAESRLLDGDVLSLCYAAGFPPSDLFWCGPTVVAYADSQTEADRVADALTELIVSREADFDATLLTPAEGVARAIAISRTASRPVVLADVQDNPGGGGSADTTGILRALLEAGASNAVVGILCDADAAAAAHAAGEGCEIEISLGGHVRVDGVEPVRACYKVKALGTGRFRTSGAVAGGLDVDLGPMALLTVGGTEIVVSSKRMQAMDLEPFRHLGVEPAERDIVVVKSAVHFRAEFGPIAEQVLLIKAPGAFADDPEDYPYERLRKTVRLRPCG